MVRWLRRHPEAAGGRSAPPASFPAGGLPSRTAPEPPPGVPAGIWDRPDGGAGAQPWETRFEFERWLGDGIIGKTFLGFDDAGARAAVTLVRGHWWRTERQQEVLARTVRRLSRVRVEHTARTLGWGFDVEDQLWIANGYVDEPSLEQVVRRYGRLEPELVLALVVSVARVLARLGEAGFVHGNLKPSNVFCSPYGPIVAGHHLLTALARAEAEYGSRHRQSAELRCAPAFTAPEVQADVRAAAGPGDVFSLACLAVFAATGGSEYPEDPTRAVAELSRGPRAAAAPSWGLRRLTAGCLHPDRTRRPTATELARAAHRHGVRRYGRDWFDHVERTGWADKVRDLNAQRQALVALSRDEDEDVDEEAAATGGPDGPGTVDAPPPDQPAPRSGPGAQPSA